MSRIRRFAGTIAWVAAAASVLPAAVVAAGELPRAAVEFSVEGEEFDGGTPVDMSGRIQPATVRERIRLETQQFRNGAWRAYDVRATMTTRRGRFAYTHDAFPGGRRYRTRAKWAETVDHLAGRTIWDTFSVRRGHL